MTSEAAELACSATPSGAPGERSRLPRRSEAPPSKAYGSCRRNLRSAVAALSEEQLETPYRPGGWTVRQLVHHVADSHMNAYVRVRLALTEDWPTIIPYQEKRWAELEDAPPRQCRPHSICCSHSMPAGCSSSLRSMSRTGSAAMCILRTAGRLSNRWSWSMIGTAAITPHTSPSCLRAWAGSSASGNPREA